MYYQANAVDVALRKESVDRNHYFDFSRLWDGGSLSARRAWIEIIQKLAHLCLKPVALRKESVDRNRACITTTTICTVALRKESVDRNSPLSLLPVLAWVALRKESVDRNRACITTTTICTAVALRKESVDRNGLGVCYYGDDVSSLSARRAWIEI